ncbi:myosin-binding protein 2-like [Abrus precatorius]|uniref:Myosin-binding protein 2-like n=1 Tax=Abrus precatorius TaxID=3816 RepID=A0A8B8JSM0_ABRPR|nr:myosin-binding protein 2-like [Abrus precatorius]
MATNKFATMLHRNTNKVVVILVYAVLEWVLIALLLLNSLFSYLITKFAKWVGLQPPCLWCSRVDHVLQSEKNKHLHKDLVCEAHAAEISKLGYCSNHRRLAETQSMCEDCLASRPNHHENSFAMRRRIAFISWVSREKQENEENIRRCSCCNESLNSQFYPSYLLLKPSWGDEDYPSKGSLIVEEAIDDEKEGDKELEFEKDHDDDEGVADEHQILSDIESFILREVAEDRSSSVSNLHSDEKDAEKDDKDDDLIITELDRSGDDNFICQFTSTMQGSLWEDTSLEFINMHFENFKVCDSHRLIPVKLIDSITEDLGERKQKTFATEAPIEAQSITLEGVGSLTIDMNTEKTSMRELESLAKSMTSEQNSVVEVYTQGITTEGAQTSVNDDNSVEAAAEERDNTQVDLPRYLEPVCSNESTQEDESSSSDDDDEDEDVFDIFIAQNNLNKSQNLSKDDKSAEAGMEDPENTLQVTLPPPEEPACSCQCMAEDESSSSSDDDTEVQNAFDEFISQNNLRKSQRLSNDDKSIEAAIEEPENTQVNLPPSEDPACSCQTIPEDQSSASKAGTNDHKYAEMIEKTISVEKNHDETSHQPAKCSESYEVEEDKLPETPSFVDGLHDLHKRESGADDSVDGSVASEVEYGDPVLTIDRLKTVLKAERKALSAVYQELEEERSASAVAANQTMAMITRLQEEKAAMQMEALQYQRMMEEQSEYDQEALQLLNELMMKREKEKQELEKELEEYRQKVMEYEAKEKLSVLRRMKDGTVRSRDSSSSCSNTGYTDELSIDLNREAKDEDNGFFNHDEGNDKNATEDKVSNLEEMAIDCVKHVSALDDTLAEFEEERASILEQLKALEEKIISLGDNEELLDDIKLIEHSSIYGDKDLNENCNFISLEENEYSNGFSDDKHSSRRTMGSLAKKLLPYLDAADNETEETFTFERQLESESVDMQNLDPMLEMDSMKTSIEHEVDRVYERLQALETDKEFLQHCMGSIQNGGEKGVDLLQEILQHLRDLKAVELRLKNLGNDPL